MSPLLHRFLYAAVLLLLALGVARAQDAPPPAYIARVEGTATLDRDGEVTPAVLNMPLIPGDRVRTAAGRVEIRFPDGTGIEVGEYSAVELLTPTRVRLLAGTLDRLEPLQANTMNAASASYLPQGLQMYSGTFDQYGSWRYAPSYGYVWYPSVAPDWRPYYNGYWEPIRAYGWTWIGADLWAWPTHHYGRWGHARGAWFWVPDRTFGPAWVSWGATPGYVSWCPLGFDNRPVFALSIGYSNAWSGWTILPRTHFGARGYDTRRYAVDPRHLPRDAAFVTQSVPPVAVPRHVANGSAATGGIAVLRGTSRQSSVNSQQAPVVTPRAEDRATPTYDRRPTTSDYRPRTPDYRPPTPDYRPLTPDYRPVAPENRAAVPPPIGIPRVDATPRPAPSFGVPRVNTEPRSAPSVGVPRFNAIPPPPSAAPQQQRAAPQQAAPPQAPPPQAAPPQRAAPSGGHDRSGGTAQPRGEQPRGGESNRESRRRG